MTEFVCPLFNAKTTDTACRKMRERVWTGHKMEYRRGCQAAMRCGKCPIELTITFEIYNGEWKTSHMGKELRNGRFHTRILERIRRIVMRESIMNEVGVPPVERQLLLTANERIDASLGGAVALDVASDNDDLVKPVRKAAPKSKPASSSIASAAATGDLAAAINA